MLKVVINKDYKNQIKDFVLNLRDNFKNKGEVIESARNIIKVFDLDGLAINVKSFRKPHLFNQFIYATFRQSKAKRSYIYAHKLLEQGINTPIPLAYIEEKRGLLFKNSVYLSVHEKVDGILRELYYGSIDQHRELICQFAMFTAKLHNARILHLDFSPGNILYKKEDGKYSFYLVDLNRMKFDEEIKLDAACYNFRRLWGDDNSINLFIEVYARIRHWDVKLCLAKTFQYREQFWIQFRKRHPGAKPFDTWQ